MNRSIIGRGVVPAALALALGLAACGGDDDSGSTETTDSESLSGSIEGAGASSQQAAQQAWIASYSEVAPDVTVTYQPVGSGAGREQFLQGATAFAGSDAYLTEEELTSAAADSVCGPDGAVEFPVYISPIALPYNLPGVDDLKLSPQAIAGIFAGEITEWNAPEIAETNPGVTLPTTPINPVHRSDESGTTENFTEYLAAVAPDVWTVGAIETWPAEYGGEAGAQTSGVVSAVQAGEGSIGYADASQVGELSTADVGVGGDFTEYSPEAAAAVLDASSRVEGRSAGDIAIDVARDTTEAGTYPIVLVSYAIACASYEDETTAQLVADYLGYIVSEDGQAVAAENAGSAPITDTLRSDIEEILDGIASGGFDNSAPAGDEATDEMTSDEMTSDDMTSDEMTSEDMTSEEATADAS